MRDYYGFKTKEILGKRSVKKGDVILTSSAFVYVIDSHQRGQYCDHCIVSSRTKQLKPCKQCGFIFYCGPQCENDGKNIHKWECQYLKALGTYTPPDFARLIVRLIFRLKDGGETYAESYGEKKSRKFKDLMNHYRDIKEDLSQMRDVEYIYKELKRMVGDQNLPNESDFIGLYGRVLVNRFCLMDSYLCPVGSVVYLAGSIFDHSCNSNAYASFNGTSLEIRSLVDWPVLDMKKVYISYIDIMKTTSQRREELYKNWYFWCECPICLDTNRQVFENCVKCENPDCGAPVLVPERPDPLFKFGPEPTLVCKICSWPVDREKLKEYQSAVTFTRQRLRGMKEDAPVIESCLAILERQKNLFSSLNVWRVRALDFTFNAAYCSGIFGHAIDYGRRNLEGMTYHYGRDHPTLGLFLMKLGKSLLYLKEYREGLAYVEEAERILCIALGEDHQLVSEEIARLKVIANEDLEIYMERRLAERVKSEHEKVCKHCGRKKAAGAKREAEDSENISSIVNRNNNKSSDVYNAIKSLKLLTETLSKLEHSEDVKNGFIYYPGAKQNKDLLSTKFGRIGDIYFPESEKARKNIYDNGETSVAKSARKYVASPLVKTERNGDFLFSRENSESKYESNGDEFSPKPVIKTGYSEIITNGDKYGKNSRNLLKSGNNLDGTQKEEEKQIVPTPLVKKRDNNLAVTKAIEGARLQSVQNGDEGLSKSVKAADGINNMANSEKEEEVGMKVLTKHEKSLQSSSEKAAEGNVIDKVLPSALSRLYRYGDKLGVNSKSKSSRDSVYSIIGSSTKRLEKADDVVKSVEIKETMVSEFSKPVSATHSVKNEISKPTPPEASHAAEAGKDKAHPATLETEKVTDTEKKDKISSAKLDESQAVCATLPRIGRLYAINIEQKWGLDYIPDKAIKKTATNVYSLPETNKIWDKYLADIELNWALYIADVECEDESDSEEEETE